MGDQELVGKYPIPRYIPAQKYQSDKGDDNMYPFKHLGFNLNEVEQRNDDILSNLTLFAPFSHEDDIAPSTVHLERPITPINDEIKAPPVTCQRLTKLVRRRIIPRPDVELLGQDDQKELGAIIMGEVNGIWPDIKTQVDDPFLSQVENKELQRRITVHIVTVCQQLFIHYLQKAQILNKRGVFSGPANMSRLKAQLGLDANKFLNILTIRRYIVADIKNERIEVASDDEDEGRKASLPDQQFPLLSYQGLIEASRPKSKSRRRRFATPQEDILELEDNMPNLDTSKLENLLQDLPTNVPIHSRTSDHSNREKVKGPKQKQVARKTSEDLSMEKIRLRKSGSVPLLSYGDTLYEELGVGTRPPSAMSTGDITEEPTPGDDTIRLQKLKDEQISASKPQPGTWEYQQEDLRRLVGRGADDGKGGDTEEDLPPLLQALTSTPQQELRRREIEHRLRVLEEREQERLARETIEIQPPTHAQPATVNTTLPNKMKMRTSDVRVSDRVCLSSMTLNKYQTVYNDLIDEIDPATVKKLDSNLFLGDEITEVYKEIMKTVPTDHLDPENDIMIEPAADALNLSSALASSTLSKKKHERIINPDLHRDIQPPWGSLDVTDWAKTPFSPPKDIKGRNMVNPMVPHGEGLAMNDFYGSNYQPPEGAHTGKGATEKVPEVMARSYASWLTWWKNTINSDDYMKYLSTQESDYMGAIFHFYNSDDEDDDDTPAAKARVAKKLAKEQQAEKIHKVQELKTMKTQFSDGFWNANSILMGGLGQEPTTDEAETEITVKTPTSEHLGLAGQRTPTRLIARKSQRPLASDTASGDHTSKSREGDASRNSQSQSHLETKPQSAGKHTSSGSQKTEGERSAQDRLEKIWSSLLMTDSLKLDMAIKYSSDQYHAKLDDAIEIWEEATSLVVQREAIIKKLEDFERLASDPNRFFEKGHRGSSVARLEEARMRSLYYKKIENYEDDLVAILEHLERDYQDTLTYEGRPYKEKMHWDRTEMLYWLQEERKQQAMEYEARMRNINSMSLNMVHLDPLSTKQPTAVK